jgi:hypothetical protein
LRERSGPPTNSSAITQPTTAIRETTRNPAWMPATNESRTMSRARSAPTVLSWSNAFSPESVPASTPWTTFSCDSVSCEPAALAFSATSLSEVLSKIAVVSPSPIAPPAIWNMYISPPARLARASSSAVTAAVVIEG